MQWEITTTQVRDPKFVFKCGAGRIIKEEGPGPGKENSPSDLMAMTFNNEGWVDEKLGPRSGHWKRLARAAQSEKGKDTLEVKEAKRTNQIPLQELDTNTLNLKRGKAEKSLIIQKS